MKRLFDSLNRGLGILFSLADTLFQRNLWSCWRSKWRQKRITSDSSSFISFGLNQSFFQIFRHAVSLWNFHYVRYSLRYRMPKLFKFGFSSWCWLSTASILNPVKLCLLLLYMITHDVLIVSNSTLSFAFKKVIFNA